MRSLSRKAKDFSFELSKNLIIIFSKTQKKRRNGTSGVKILGIKRKFVSAERSARRGRMLHKRLNKKLGV
jgi:hypothetical protein